VHVSQRRDIACRAHFFTVALTVHGDPGEVINDRGLGVGHVIENLVPAAPHNTGQNQNNRVECDHGRLKARLRPMRGLKTERTASVVNRGTRWVRTCVVATTARCRHRPLLWLAIALDQLRPAI
jgi:transposase, IS6 family